MEIGFISHAPKEYLYASSRATVRIKHDFFLLFCCICPFSLRRVECWLGGRVCLLDASPFISFSKFAPSQTAGFRDEALEGYGGLHLRVAYPWFCRRCIVHSRGSRLWHPECLPPTDSTFAYLRLSSELQDVLSHDDVNLSDRSTSLCLLVVVMWLARCACFPISDHMTAT